MAREQFKSPLRHRTQSETLFRSLPSVAYGSRVEATRAWCLGGELPRLSCRGWASVVGVGSAPVQ